MACLEKRNRIYRIVLRLNGQRFSRSLETESEPAAQLALAKLNDGLHRLKVGLLQIDPEDDVITSLLSTGSVRQPPNVQRKILVGKLLDDYLEAIPSGSIESNSHDMLRTHVRNLKRHLGVRIPTNAIGLATLQGYINLRSKDKGIHGGTVSPVTIRKEITTFHAAWSWANDA